MPCERLVGRVKDRLVNKKVRDSRDTDDNNVSISGDRHIIGFINNALYLNENAHI